MVNVHIVDLLADICTMAAIPDTFGDMDDEADGLPPRGLSPI